MYKSKRIICLLMAIITIIGSMPMEIFATEEKTEDKEDSPDRVTVEEIEDSISGDLKVTMDAESGEISIYDYLLKGLDHLLKSDKDGLIEALIASLKEVSSRKGKASLEILDRIESSVLAAEEDYKEIMTDKAYNTMTFLLELLKVEKKIGLESPDELLREIEAIKEGGPRQQLKDVERANLQEVIEGLKVRIQAAQDDAAQDEVAQDDAAQDKLTQDEADQDKLTKDEADQDKGEDKTQLEKFKAIVESGRTLSIDNLKKLEKIIEDKDLAKEAHSLRSAEFLNFIDKLEKEGLDLEGLDYRLSYIVAKEKLEASKTLVSKYIGRKTESKNLLDLEDLKILTSIVAKLDGTLEEELDSLILKGLKILAAKIKTKEENYKSSGFEERLELLSEAKKDEGKALLAMPVETSGIEADLDQLAEEQKKGSLNYSRLVELEKEIEKSGTEENRKRFNSILKADLESIKASIISDEDFTFSYIDYYNRAKLLKDVKVIEQEMESISMLISNIKNIQQRTRKYIEVTKELTSLQTGSDSTYGGYQTNSDYLGEIKNSSSKEMIDPNLLDFYIDFYNLKFAPGNGKPDRANGVIFRQVNYIVDFVEQESLKENRDEEQIKALLEYAKGMNEKYFDGGSRPKDVISGYLKEDIEELILKVDIGSEDESGRDDQIVKDNDAGKENKADKDEEIIQKENLLETLKAIDKLMDYLDRKGEFLLNWTLNPEFYENKDLFHFNEFGHEVNNNFYGLVQLNYGISSAQNGKYHPNNQDSNSIDTGSGMEEDHVENGYGRSQLGYGRKVIKQIASDLVKIQKSMVKVNEDLTNIIDLYNELQTYSLEEREVILETKEYEPLKNLMDVSSLGEVRSMFSNIKSKIGYGGYYQSRTQKYTGGKGVKKWTEGLKSAVYLYRRWQKWNIGHVKTILLNRYHGDDKWNGFIYKTAHTQKHGYWFYKGKDLLKLSGTDVDTPLKEIEDIIDDNEDLIEDLIVLKNLNFIKEGKLSDDRNYITYSVNLSIDNGEDVVSIKNISLKDTLAVGTSLENLEVILTQNGTTFEENIDLSGDKDILISDKKIKYVSGDSLKLNIDNIKKTEKIVLNYKVKVNPDKVESLITNKISLIGQVGDSQIGPINRECSIPYNSIKIYKELTAKEYYADKNIKELSYLIRASVNGRLENIVMTDVLPDPLILKNIEKIQIGDTILTEEDLIGKDKIKIGQIYIDIDTSNGLSFRISELKNQTINIHFNTSINPNFKGNKVINKVEIQATNPETGEEVTPDPEDPNNKPEEETDLPVVLEKEKVASESSVEVGEKFNYTISLKNTDNNRSYKGRFEDKLPEELEIVNKEELEKYGFKVEGNTVSKDLILIEKGKNLDIVIEVRALAASEDIKNTAILAEYEKDKDGNLVDEDGKPSEKEEEEVVDGGVKVEDKAKEGKLSVEKEVVAKRDSYSIGDLVRYRVTIKADKGAVDKIEFKDQWPEGMNLEKPLTMIMDNERLLVNESKDNLKLAKRNIAIDIEESSIDLKLDRLRDQTLVLEYQLRISDKIVETVLVNKVDLKGAKPGTDGEGEDEIKPEVPEEEVIVPVEIDLTKVNDIKGKKEVTVGDKFQYSLSIRRATEEKRAWKGKLEDSLPEGLKLDKDKGITLNGSELASKKVTYEEATRKIVISDLELASNKDELVITIPVIAYKSTSSSGARNSFTVKEVDEDGQEIPSTEEETEDKDSIDILSQLEFTKSVDKKEVKNGEILNYTIKLVNKDERSLTGKISDNLPEGLEFDSFRVKKGSEWAKLEEKHVNLKNLPKDKVLELELRVRINSEPGNTIENKALVEFENQFGEDDSKETNKVKVRVIDESKLDISLEKTNNIGDKKFIKVGDEFEYSIVLKNKDDRTWKGRLEDKLEDYLELISAKVEPNKGNLSIDGNTLVLENIELAGEESLKVTLKVKAIDLTKGLENTVVANEYELDGDGEPVVDEDGNLKDKEGTKTEAKDQEDLDIIYKEGKLKIKKSALKNIGNKDYKYAPGESVKYNVEIRPTGDQDDKKVTVRDLVSIDSLPSELLASSDNVIHVEIEKDGKVTKQGVGFPRDQIDKIEKGERGTIEGTILGKDYTICYYKEDGLYKLRLGMERLDGDEILSIKYQVKIDEESKVFEGSSEMEKEVTNRVECFKNENERCDGAEKTIVVKRPIDISVLKLSNVRSNNQGEKMVYSNSGDLSEYQYMINVSNNSKANWSGTITDDIYTMAERLYDDNNRLIKTDNSKKRLEIVKVIKWDTVDASNYKEVDWEDWVNEDNDSSKDSGQISRRIENLPPGKTAGLRIVVRALEDSSYIIEEDGVKELHYAKIRNRAVVKGDQGEELEAEDLGVKLLGEFVDIKSEMFVYINKKNTDEGMELIEEDDDTMEIEIGDELTYFVVTGLNRSNLKDRDEINRQYVKEMNIVNTLPDGLILTRDGMDKSDAKIFYYEDKDLNLNEDENVEKEGEKAMRANLGSQSSESIVRRRFKAAVGKFYKMSDAELDKLITNEYEAKVERVPRTDNVVLRRAGVDRTAERISIADENKPDLVGEGLLVLQYTARVTKETPNILFNTAEITCNCPRDNQRYNAVLTALRNDIDVIMTKEAYSIGKDGGKILNTVSPGEKFEYRITLTNCSEHEAGIRGSVSDFKDIINPNLEVFDQEITVEGAEVIGKITANKTSEANGGTKVEIREMKTDPLEAGERKNIVVRIPVRVKDNVRVNMIPNIALSREVKISTGSGDEIDHDNRIQSNIKNLFVSGQSESYGLNIEKTAWDKNGKEAGRTKFENGDKVSFKLEVNNKNNSDRIASGKVEKLRIIDYMPQDLDLVKDSVRISLNGRDITSKVENLSNLNKVEFKLVDLEISDKLLVTFDTIVNGKTRTRTITNDALAYADYKIGEDQMSSVAHSSKTVYVDPSAGGKPDPEDPGKPDKPEYPDRPYPEYPVEDKVDSSKEALKEIDQGYKIATSTDRFKNKDTVKYKIRVKNNNKDKKTIENLTIVDAIPQDLDLIKESIRVFINGDEISLEDERILDLSKTKDKIVLNIKSIDYEDTVELRFKAIINIDGKAKTILNEARIFANFEGDKGDALANPKVRIRVGEVDDDLKLTDDHIAYMQGYPDKTFGPRKNMTRAEVAAMFARLTAGGFIIEPGSIGFKDVKVSAWYYKHVSFLAEHGILEGYKDGSFKPGAAITRAEFATIAARFDDLEGGENIFKDVEGHWAEEYIKSASSKGWIVGYPDGSFRPNENISREEAVTMVNRMLERQADPKFIEENIGKGIVSYTDLKKKRWSYLDIMEASNAHDHKIVDDREIWLRLREIKKK